MKSTLIILFIAIGVLATQWQPASIIPPGTITITGPSFTGDNMRIYCSIYDSYYHSEIAFYDWSGSQWFYGGKVAGDVNTTQDEEQPFITYDNQKLFFEKSNFSPHHLWVATWNGIGFYNSVELNSSINSADCRFPTLTQDGLKLYFSRASGNGTKIFESLWNGVDWALPIILPPEINEGGGIDRSNVLISPDGDELYFTGAGASPSKLAFSQKIDGVWQQWQYCDSNINIPGCSISGVALTYAPYSTQELYFARNYSPGTLTWHALRSPVAVEPASLGQIKATYAK
jgi:hypothetical protein